MRWLYALVDCNTFYASCERVFRPDLRGRPIAVLSNNDGMIVAASREAKAIGCVLGVPAFQAEPLFRRYDVSVFSSNYTLYGDLSARVMRTLAEHAPALEIYSIDEAFLRIRVDDGPLSMRRAVDLEAWLRDLRAIVYRWTKIPVSIGLGPSKTLAKAANRLAKKRPELGGVFNLTDLPDGLDWLARLDIEDVWGIGHRYAKKLRSWGVYTAADFVTRMSRDWVRKNMTVLGLQTWLELRGQSVIPLEGSPPPKKEIISSRSFGRPVRTWQGMVEACAYHVSRAAEKLRAQGGVCSSVLAWVQTDQFVDDRPGSFARPYYSNAASRPLSVATAYTPELIAAATEALDSIYRSGLEYKKCGIMLSGIERDLGRQLSLLTPSPEVEAKRRVVMRALDGVNSRWGREVVRYAVSGTDDQDREWKMRRWKLSPRYTTSWQDLPIIGQSPV